MTTDDPDKIDTLEKARDLSLIKWGSIQELARQLFVEIETRCGFCSYSEHIAGKFVSCGKCPVQKTCKEITATSSNIEEDLIKLIDDVLIYLSELKKDDN